MRGVNHDIMFMPPQRSVSLYWVEKWLLLIDLLQIWCLLWIIVAPQLPHTWNIITYSVLFFNLDIFHLYFLRLDASNTLITSELGKEMLPRILLAAIPVGVSLLASVVLIVGNRWVNLAHVRNNMTEAAETKTDRTVHCRRSTARVSLSKMFVTDAEEKENEQSALKANLRNAWYCASFLGVQSRLLLVVWFFAPVCNAVFPVVFCADQADICSERPLFFSRLMLGLLTLAGAFFTIYYVGRHVKRRIVAQTDKHHEEYVQQKEIEYMLHVNDSWRIQMLWMFTSFKRECRRVYYRQSLMIVKFVLCLLISLLGTELFRKQYGLAWVFRLIFPNGFQSAAAPSMQGDVALGTSGQRLSSLDQLLINPLGIQMRTILGSTVVIVAAACFLIRPPFRQRSSNVLHALGWLLLVCLSSVAFALACTASPIGVLLPANLIPLLKTLHVVAICSWIVVYSVGVIRTLLPNSTSALVSTRGNNLQELTEGQKDEDLRQRQKKLKKVKRRLVLNHGARMVHNAWFRVATNTRLARNSLSAVWSRGSSCALDEDGALYPSFLDSPWPISFYEGRYFIVTYPQVLRVLKRARNVINRYLFADKTLVPLTVLDSAHADLQQHLVTFLSLREQNASLSREDERLTAPNVGAKSILSNPKELNAALSEAERQLALFDKELGDVDEDSTDAEDEKAPDALSDATFGSRASVDTGSETEERNGAAHGRRSLLSLPDNTKRPPSPRRVGGSAGGLLRAEGAETPLRLENRDQGAGIAADCQRVEGLLRKMRQGCPHKRMGIDSTKQGEAFAPQLEGCSAVREMDLLEAMLEKASQMKQGDWRPAAWKPSTEEAWKSIFDKLDREAADGAKKAELVGRKAAELDFEPLAPGVLHMSDVRKEKSASNEVNMDVLFARLRGGPRVGIKGVGAGLLKRQNGGPLDAIDDLLAEMEEEAGEGSITENSSSAEEADCEGGTLSTVDFEHPMLPTTVDFLEAFTSEEVRAALADGANVEEHGTAEEEFGEYYREAKESKEDTTAEPSGPFEYSTSPIKIDAIAGGNAGAEYTAVESNSIEVNERYQRDGQQPGGKVERSSGTCKRRKRRKLREKGSFSHLPESARRVALEFKVRRLSTLSHLSERFKDLPVRRLFDEMHHRQSLNHAFRWILLEAFETLSGLRSEVAPVTCLPTTLPNGGDALMAVLAARCRQRDQDLSLMTSVKRRILTKLLAIQFLSGNARRTKKPTDAMIEKMLRDFSLILGD